MNTNTKTLNSSPLNSNSSFIAAPINNIKNVANNFATNVKNSANNVASSMKNIVPTDLVNDFTEPINESINSAFENNSASFISIPIILSLGLLIILFIIVVMFREQIALAFELLWQKIKSLFGASTTAVEPPPTQTVPDEYPSPVDKSSVEKILPGKKEVFNITQNKYTYSDAEPLCKAFGAELATYDQVKEAWDKGADWCNYGWVKGQAAIYPTQQETYDKLQKGPEDQRMSCGIPGINGGFFDNPELRFGVNCYGPKPAENDADIRNIMSQNEILTPETIAYNKKVTDFKVHKSEIPVNPFKQGVWSA